jgi:hypothetical protein
MQVWVKNYNSSSTIIMQVFPSFENLLSATGYLGEAPQLSPVYGEYFNAPKVFLYANDFAGTTYNHSIFEMVGNSANTITVNNGISFYSNQSSSTQITLWMLNTSFPLNSIVYVDEPSGNGADQSGGAGINSITGGGGYSYGSQSGIWDIGYGAVGSGNWITNTIEPFNVLTGIQAVHNNTTVNGWINGNLKYPNEYLEGVLNEAGNFSYVGSTGIHAGIGQMSSYERAPSWTNISYMIVASPLTIQMPTTSIGAGSVFQANSSLLNYPSAGNTEPYNATYERVIYTIPDSFNYNYMTLYYNASWSFLYADPSYGTDFPQYHAYTFANISGVGTIEITMLQPIVQKAQPGSVSVSQTRGLSILTPGSTANYTFALLSQGSPPPSAVVNGLASTSSYEYFDASTGLLAGVGFITAYGSDLNVTFTAPPPGLYYYKFTGSYEYTGIDYSFSYSGSFNSSTSRIFSEGLDVKVISPSSMTVGSNSTLFFQLYFPNGTSPTAGETSSILGNSSLTLHGKNITLVQYNSFTLSANFSESSPANYTLQFQVTRTIISGVGISYIQIISIPVLPAPVHANSNMKMSISGPTTLISGVPSPFTLTFLTGTGVPFNLTETQSADKDLNITVKIYTKIFSTATAAVISNGTAAFNLSLPSGTYYLLVSTHLVLPSGNASSEQSMVLTVTNQTSRGLFISISIPGSIEKGHSTQGTISLSFTDGSYMSYSDTLTIASGMALNLYTSSGTYLYSPALTVQQPGKLSFTLNLSSLGSYTIYAQYNGTVSGYHAAGSASQTVTAVNYNPTQDSLSEVGAFLDNFWLNIVETIFATLAIYIGSKIFLGRRSDKKTFNTTAAATTVGMANYEELKRSGQKIPINKKDYKDINRDIRKVGK